LMGQGMLESIGLLQSEARLIEEFSSLEVREPAVQCLLRQGSNSVQQGYRHLRADDGRNLEEALLRRRQAVDTGGQDRLDGVWDAQRERMPPLLHHRPGQLLQKKRIPVRFRQDRLLQRCGMLCYGQKRLHHARLSWGDSGWSATCVA